MHRSIEVLVGRLVTDEGFRAAFRRNPRTAIAEAEGWGLALTNIEIDALLSTDQWLWDRIAGELDSRLQKVSLKEV